MKRLRGWRFAQFIAQHPYCTDQINIQRVVQNVFPRKSRLAPSPLYVSPLTAFDRNAVEWQITAQPQRNY